MITRILPVAEYDRLKGTELEAVYPYLPESARVVVVEDDSAIVGCWAACPFWHLEGVWIAPKYRGRSSVARRLWSAMRGVLWTLGARTAISSAIDPGVASMLRKLGGDELPGQHFVLSGFVSTVKSSEN